MVFMFCCILCNLRGVCAVGVCAFWREVGGRGRGDSAFCFSHENEHTD